MADPTNPGLDGIFNIDKPRGMTSHDVVAKVRRTIRMRNAELGMSNQSLRTPHSAFRIRVGHAGTLDPMATGVLPIVLGKATRLVEYLADADKAYRATLVLGAMSDTYDAEGTITSNPEAPILMQEQIERVAEAFKGEIEQLPPMHSAIKMGGKKLYELARQGIEVERKPRRVTITRLDILGYRPPLLHIFVECSKGTYIRSLAHDLGAALGTGAYLDDLTRTRHGPFTVEGAASLDDLEAAFKDGTWQEVLYPPEHILAGWQTHTATPEEELAITQGKPLTLPPPQAGERPMMVANRASGQLLAVLYWDEEQRIWKPKKVFTT
ncbi:MAG TPA: tRNA pseudouridine(55) synthase TruB [Chloroflexia bacterium]|nr:tRNA pseudouridine(55) synthase TruB [Chloroflexia bacterium]